MLPFALARSALASRSIRSACARHGQDVFPQPGVRTNSCLAAAKPELNRPKCMRTAGHKRTGGPPVGELGGKEGRGARTDGEAAPGLRCDHGKHERRGVDPVDGRGERQRRRRRRRRRPAQRAGPAAQRRPGPLRAGAAACGKCASSLAHGGDALVVMSFEAALLARSETWRHRHRSAYSGGSLHDTWCRCVQPTRACYHAAQGHGNAASSTENCMSKGIHRETLL